MRQLISVLLPALLVGGLVTPATAAPGWSSHGRELVWTAPSPVPMGDAAVEFWEGDRLLGRPRSSADLRTFTLTAPKVVDPDRFEVRLSDRRLDAEEPLRPAASPPVSLPEPLPASQVDPGTPGSFETRTGEYALDPVRLPGYEEPVEMRAVVVSPKVTGKLPLAVFLHGRHHTCHDPADPNQIIGVWPCPSGTKPLPSYRGYLQAQRLLASQGYLTVSISANGVNAQDDTDLDGGARTRSELLRQHLTRWADWGARPDTAPDIVKAGPLADLSKVLLVGHSRGGEGANRAALDSVGARWTIRGQVLIGPTAFGQNPAPDVPSATILPGCDGDVHDLQGQMYVDATRGVSHGAALHSSLYMVGANHNYFNAEWTPGQAEGPSWDDFPDADTDAVCGTGKPTRLTAAQQQTAAATYIAAAARLFVLGDDRVLPLLDGSGVRAPSADPARVLSHALGGARTPFVVPDAASSVSGSARKCMQVTEDEKASCGHNSVPHHTPFGWVNPEPDRYTVAMKWSGVKAATMRPGKPVSLAGSRSLALRLIVPENKARNRFDVAITDARGTRVSLGTVSLDGLPATERLYAGWAQEVRVALPTQGVDLHQVVSLELKPHDRDGKAWLIDAHGWKPGAPDPRAVALPRVDVGQLKVEEGDSGTRTHQIPVRITGKSAGTVRLFIGEASGLGYKTRLVTVQPGQRTIEIPMDVVGNTRWSLNAQRDVYAKAVRGTVVGDHTGGLTVLNDDPEPKLTVTPLADKVVEGGELKWRVTLSGVADSAIFRYGRTFKPSGTELSTTDVDASWLADNSRNEQPLPSRPLSSTTLMTSMGVYPGQLTTEITVPTVADTVAESGEQIRLRFETSPPGGSSFEVVGTVTD